MKKPKNKLKIILSAVVVVCLTTAFVFRYQAVNNQYPAPPLESYPMNETVPYHNSEFTVTGFEMDDGEKLLEQKGMDPNLILVPGLKTDTKLCLVPIKIKNTTDEDKTFDLTYVVLQLHNSHSVLSFELFNDFNEEYGMYPVVKPGEEVTLTLPYVFNSIAYPESFWSDIENQDKSLVLSVYPTKKAIQLP